MNDSQPRIRSLLITIPSHQPASPPVMSVTPLLPSPPPSQIPPTSSHIFSSTSKDETCSSFDSLLTSLQAQAIQVEQLVQMAQPSLHSNDASLLAFTSSLTELESLIRHSQLLLQSEESSLSQMEHTVLPSLRQLNAELLEHERATTQMEKERAVEMIQQQMQIEKMKQQLNIASPPPRDRGDDSRLPLAPSTKSSANANMPQSPTSSTSRSSTKTKQQQSSSTKDKSSSSSSSSSASNSAPSSSSKKSAHAHLPTDAITMSHLTEAEFLTIPGYMRGRLDLARVNASIDAWLQLLREKYTILNMKSSAIKQLNEQQTKRYQAWLEEETEETNNAYFISGEDIRISADLQSLGSTNLKALFLGLRHVGRVKNISVAGQPKYLLVMKS